MHLNIFALPESRIRTVHRTTKHYLLMLLNMNTFKTTPSSYI